MKKVQKRPYTRKNGRSIISAKARDDVKTYLGYTAISPATISAAAELFDEPINGPSHVDGWRSIHDDPPKKDQEIIALVGTLRPGEPGGMVVVRRDDKDENWLCFVAGSVHRVLNITQWRAVPLRPRVI